jgi:peptidoglycan/LPS O-acetylase OafA/YrhL
MKPAPNHFDLARFVAALMVMASHAFALTQRGPYVEPLVYLSGHRTDMGAVGVAAFFIMSGYLITGSWQRNHDLGDFLRARALRILPGLAVALIFCAAVGALLTVSPERYLPSALSFVGRNLLMFRGQGELEGVFLHNPLSPTINGSLWTLRYEVMCYLAVAALGLVRQLRAPVLLVVWALCCAGIASGLAEQVNTGRELLSKLLPLLGWFMAGACAYQWRALTIPLTVWLGVAALAVLVPLLGGNLVLMAPLLALALLRLLQLPGPLTSFGRYGDFSYGLYIYAFPVQQWLVSQMPQQTPWENFLMAFPLTLLLAVLSWYLVERPCLRLKSRPRPLPQSQPAGGAPELSPLEPPAR